MDELPLEFSFIPSILELMVKNPSVLQSGAKFFTDFLENSPSELTSNIALKSDLLKSFVELFRLVCGKVEEIEESAAYNLARLSSILANLVSEEIVQNNSIGPLFSNIVASFFNHPSLKVVSETFDYWYELKYQLECDAHDNEDLYIDPFITLTKSLCIRCRINAEEDEQEEMELFRRNVSDLMINVSLFLKEKLHIYLHYLLTEEINTNSPDWNYIESILFIFKEALTTPYDNVIQSEPLGKVVESFKLFPVTLLISKSIIFFFR